MTADLTAAIEAGRLAVGRLPSRGICKAHGRDANTCWDCSAIAAIEAAAPLIAAAVREQVAGELRYAAHDTYDAARNLPVTDSEFSNQLFRTGLVMERCAKTVLEGGGRK